MILGPLGVRCLLLAGSGFSAEAEDLGPLQGNIPHRSVPDNQYIILPPTTNQDVGDASRLRRRLAEDSVPGNRLFRIKTSVNYRAVMLRGRDQQQRFVLKNEILRVAGVDCDWFVGQRVKSCTDNGVGLKKR